MIEEMSGWTQLLKILNLWKVSKDFTDQIITMDLSHLFLNAFTNSKIYQLEAYFQIEICSLTNLNWVRLKQKRQSKNTKIPIFSEQTIYQWILMEHYFIGGSSQD